MAPTPPESKHEAGSMNIAYRRKVAEQIDQDNQRLLERLVRAGPAVATKTQLNSRYHVHEELVARTSKIRRRWDADLTKAPPDTTRAPHPPATPRARPPLHAPKLAQIPPGP